MPALTASAHRPKRRAGRANLTLIGLRVDMGYSREALARRAGIGRETVRIAESGFVPTPRIQFAIATALGQTPLKLWPIETQARPR